MGFSPTSTAQGSNIFGAIGGILEGVGGIVQGRAEESAGKYNGAIYEQQAQAERNSQVLLEAQKRKILKSTIGSQVAGYGAAGIRYSGSPIDVAVDSIANANLDISIDKYNSEVAARGKENEASMARYEGKQKASVSYMQAGKSLLSTAASYYQSQREIGS